MAQLTVGSSEVRTVFDLLGHNENDVTAALGFTLSRSPQLLQAIVADATGVSAGDDAAVYLQRYERDGGFTDVEIAMSGRLLIIEAKIGWDLPGDSQLAKYAQRVHREGGGLIAVVSECSREYAQARELPTEVDGVPVIFRRWQSFIDASDQAVARSRGVERFALRELAQYLRGLMTLQDPRSNIVRVVALNHEPQDWMDLTFAQVVFDKNRYFNPVSRKGFPREPPNYFGFRLDGRLADVRHVDDWKVVQHPHDDIPEIYEWVDWTEDPHYLYTFGPPIEPAHEVRTGRGLSFGRHCEAAIDLLLTSKTIGEARDKTRERLA